MKVLNYTIKFKHNTSAQGGIRSLTQCSIATDEEEMIQYAFCNPKDNFCRETGRKISLSRAMQALRIPKSSRKQIWEKYRQMKPDGRW